MEQPTIDDVKQAVEDDPIRTLGAGVCLTAMTAGYIAGASWFFTFTVLGLYAVARVASTLR